MRRRWDPHGQARGSSDYRGDEADSRQKRARCAEMQPVRMCQSRNKWSQSMFKGVRPLRLGSSGGCRALNSTCNLIPVWGRVRRPISGGDCARHGQPSLISSVAPYLHCYPAVSLISTFKSIPYDQTIYRIRLATLQAPTNNLCIRHVQNNLVQARPAR